MSLNKLYPSFNNSKPFNQNGINIPIGSNIWNAGNNTFIQYDINKPLIILNNSMFEKLKQSYE